MKRITLSLATLGALAVALAFTAGLPGSASAESHKHTFTVVVQETEATLTPADFFATPPEQNAQASEDAPVYRNGRKVGLAETIITFTRVTDDDVAAMIECSVELPGGNLLFSGSVHLADLGAGAAVPVVRGTGKYTHASGVVTLVAAADGSSTDLRFDFATNK